MGPLTGGLKSTLRLLVALIVIGGTGPAAAQVQRDVVLKDVPDTQILNLTPVVAPSARCAALSEVAGLLAIGHKPGAGSQPVTGPHISLFRLDPQGKPTDGPPVAITLPRPDSLNAHPNFPLGMAFHPAFGLLYVWQEIDGAKREEPGDAARYKDFDHFLVYDVEAAEPKLLESYCRGSDFAYGSTIGGIALNATATRFYVPNIMHAPITGKVPVCGVGCLFLDPDGLPLLQEADSAPSTGPAPNGAPPDPKIAAANRATKLAELQKLKAAGTAIKPRLLSTNPSNIFSNLPPSGLGFVPIAENVVIFGGTAGPVTWDEGDRRARLMSFLTEPYIANRQYVAGHPTLPVIFTSVTVSPYLYRMEHADGHLTLAPQQWTIEGATFHSPPVVMAKRSQVAVGGAGKVHVIGIDKDGFLKQERLQAVVLNPTVEALAYSEKFDRLYVTTEKPK